MTAGGSCDDFQNSCKAESRLSKSGQASFSLIAIRPKIIIEDLERTTACCAQTSVMAPNDGEKKDPRAWDALTPPVAEWILDAVSSMGFHRMTPVQASTIPLFIQNKDVVVEVCVLIDAVRWRLLNTLL
jgi:hypothetical protein